MGMNVSTLPFQYLVSDIVPVGTILPWLKSFTGTPALHEFFLECNGQVVSDAASPFDGETLPNLNGNLFLRGNTTSGGTGGSTTITHSFNFNQYNITPQGNAVFSVDNHTGVQPPYYDVVWIVKIK